APHPSGDELERSGRDLLSGAGDADDHALTPAAVAGLERRAHQLDVADAFEGVVGAPDLVRAALGHVHEIGNEILADLVRIDEMGHAEALAPFLPGIVEVDADDHAGADQPQALDHVEADAAEAEDDALRARLDLGGVDHRADAGSHAAADVADLVERRVLADFRHCDLRQHGEIRESRAAHVVVDLLAADGEAGAAVGHDALALGGADRGAQVGLARQARRALPTLRRVERDDVVALLHRGDARPNVDHDARALVPEDRGEQAFRIGARARELVGVADAG